MSTGSDVRDHEDAGSFVLAVRGIAGLNTDKHASLTQRAGVHSIIKQAVVCPVHEDTVKVPNEAFKEEAGDFLHVSHSHQTYEKNINLRIIRIDSK